MSQPRIWIAPGVEVCLASKSMALTIDLFTDGIAFYAIHLQGGFA
jgi:hypothetical protein